MTSQEPPRIAAAPPLTIRPFAPGDEPAGIDVITGVAGLADRKDPELIRAFVAAVRGPAPERAS